MKFFESLKSLFSTFVFEGNAKLMDGKEIRIEGTLDTGSKVFIITDETELPLPDGEWVLQDGTVITTADGVIVDLKEKEDDVTEPEVETIEEPEMAEEPEVPAEQVQDVVPEVVNDLETRISDLEAQLKAIIDKINLVPEVRYSEYEKAFNDNLSTLNSRLEVIENKNKEFDSKFERVTVVEPVKQNDQIPLNSQKPNSLLGSYDEIYKNKIK